MGNSAPQRAGDSATSGVWPRSQRTQFLITEALRPYHATLLELGAKVINAVEEALGAMTTDEADTSSGSLLWSATASCWSWYRASCRRRGLRRPAITWEEFTELYRARRETARDEEVADR